MITERRNNLFYVCALIEYIARGTKNHRGDIVKAIGERGIAHLIYAAPVNHCLTFEQVSSEVIACYHIANGAYDTITLCPYRIPNYVDIGKLYTYLIEAINVDEKKDVVTLMALFSSFLSDEISNFQTGVYCENVSYLLACYNAGKLLSVA